MLAQCARALEPPTLWQVLVLNKVDNVKEKDLTYLKDALGTLNGFADVLPTSFGVISPSVRACLLHNLRSALCHCKASSSSLRATRA